MKAYRVENKKFLGSILKGIPGELFDFRWNTKGNSIIYASSTRSLALHEKAANMSRPFFGLNPNLVLAIIQLPNENYRKIKSSDLPSNWNQIGAYHPITQKIGDNFSRSEELAIYVPSALIEDEYNILVNPSMIDKCDIKVNTEAINSRLFDQRTYPS